jgi:hypothetical protein
MRLDSSGMRRRATAPFQNKDVTPGFSFVARSGIRAAERDRVPSRDRSEEIHQRARDTVVGALAAKQLLVPGWLTPPAMLQPGE